MRVLDAAGGGLVLALSLAAGAAADVPPNPEPLGVCRTRLELKKTDATEWPSITEERATRSTDEQVGETIPIDGDPEDAEEEPEEALVSREFTWWLHVAAPGTLPCNVSVTGRTTIDTLLMDETMTDLTAAASVELVSPPPGFDPGAVSRYGIFQALLLACGQPVIDAFNANCTEQVSSRVTDTHATNEDWGEWSEGLFVDTVYETKGVLPPPPPVPEVEVR